MTTEERLLSLAAGVCPETAPADFVSACASAGWPACGIWYDAATWTDAVAGEVRLRLDDTGLIALDMEPIFVTPDGDHGNAVIEAAATVGARNLLVVSRGVDDDRFVDRFGELCDLAAAHGIGCSLEFMAFMSIRDLPQATRRPRRGRPAERGRVDRQPASCPNRWHGRRRGCGRSSPTAVRPAVRCAGIGARAARGRGPRRPPHAGCGRTAGQRARRRAPRAHRTLVRDPLRPASLGVPRSHRPGPSRSLDHPSIPPAMSQTPLLGRFAHRNDGPNSSDEPNAAIGADRSSLGVVRRWVVGPSSGWGGWSGRGG